MKKLLRYGWGLVVAVASLPAQGQDLMARQAPIDVKLRAVDSVSIGRLLKAETIEEPAMELYRTWSNNSVFNPDCARPVECKIDLRQFCMPSDSRVVNSHYGYRRQFRRQHYGTDIKGYMGDTIRSVFSGKVRVVKNEPAGFGKYVVIRHPNGLETIYGHMSKQLVAEDQVVEVGEPIGLVGLTGRTTGPHIHFETRLLNEKIDPEILFDFESGDIRGDFYVFRSNGCSQLMAAHDVSKLPDMAPVLAEAKAEESRAYQQKKMERSTRSRVYKVRTGDTLSKIAKKHGVTVDQLCRLNHISRTKMLKPGQILKCS